MKWTNTDNKLVKEMKFSTQTALAEFFVKVAEICDRENHHVDVVIRKCSVLRLELFTHTSKTVTDNDIALAEKIDRLEEDYLK